MKISGDAFEIMVVFCLVTSITSFTWSNIAKDGGGGNDDDETMMMIMIHM
jgi:hypothetical protein